MNRTLFTSQFSFDKTKRRLLGEVSDIGIPAGNGYPDAMRITSDVTGKTITFVKDIEKAIQH